MDPMRRIEGIKCAFGGCEEEAAEVRAAARTLERSFSPAEVFAAVLDQRFPRSLIAAAEGSKPEMETAWLTLAAAGPRRVRQVLAWRASQLLDPAKLAALAMAGRRARQRGFAHAAATAGDPGAAAAMSLLAHLTSRELRAMVRARPALDAAYRRHARVPAPTPRPVLG
ncbi:MAG TPA: hypothetical protein VFU11_05275 [Solirubrobacterales bacterium]|nr:hypothetical protein [Solirubrobacterales bacterium]